MVGITRSKVILMDFMRDFHIYHLYITYILYNYIFIYLFIYELGICISLPVADGILNDLELHALLCV